ncbi:ABC transporter substrate-binding protein [Nocardioides panaciterrulae]|uniref:Peptide/nickel transport system substrate-binding protein n=1 Tax=Nocardioides panaciterrulae TaxID=661492 RepID=A0A7Y9E5Q6_9ACTN|nr:peptide/nickel transport system substrate-binding protein [Nocardioides panaciterrulae]
MTAGLLATTLVPGAALTAASAPASAADSTTFTVGLLNEADSFNPFLGIEAESYEMWGLTYDYMIHYSMKDMSPEPGLATSWKTSDDGLTWTFDIRTGVKWSDGQDLTAEDIAFTYNRVLEGGPWGSTWGSYLTGVTKVAAPDATHVVLTLKKPNAVLPLLPIPIVPEHVWKDVTTSQVKSYSAEPKDGQPVVGEGPFKLVEGTAGGSTYRFEANKDYWGGAPHVDQVVFRVYKSEDPMVQALIKGEIDFAEGISPLQVKSLQGQSGITAHNGDSPGFDEIAFNAGSVDTKTGKPIGDPNPAVLDPKFRHALGFAIDRDQLITKVYQGAGQPGDSIIPPAYSSYRWTPPADQAFTFDLDKAGQLLDQAGYTMGSDGQRTMPDGSPIGTLRLDARSSSDTSLNTMNYFKEWLDQLGIKSTVRTYESSKLTDIILQGDFDVFQWGWYVEPDPDSMLSYMTCGQRGGWSDSWYCNPQYDALYQHQHEETDQAKREQEVKQMQQLLFADSPYLVTAYNTIGEAVRSDRFACFQPQPDPGGIWLIQYGVHNYISARPADQAGNCDGVSSAIGATAASESTGTSNTFWVGAGVVVVLLAGAGGVLAMRRRSSVGERE